jgi:hypothetical protein
MKFMKSEKIEKAFLDAISHISKPDYPKDEGLEMLWDTAQGVAPFGGGEEGDIYFEAGIEFALAHPNVQSVYRLYDDETAFYFVGSEDEIIKRFEVVYNCICGKSVILLKGCQCGGN